nr:hypothetical protein CFP56_57659 [Quercus suber]
MTNPATSSDSKTRSEASGTKPTSFSIIPAISHYLRRVHSHEFSWSPTQAVVQLMLATWSSSSTRRASTALRQQGGPDAYTVEMLRDSSRGHSYMSSAFTRYDVTDRGFEEQRHVYVPE